MSVIHQVKQGSPAWFKLRAGVVTASEADKVISPVRLEPCKARNKADETAYFLEKIAEAIIGEPVTKFEGTSFTDRGTVMEAYAREEVEMVLGVEIEEVGFVTNDEGTLGASPDGFLSNGGGLELKSPGAAQHVANLLNPDRFVMKHRGQCQVGMIASEKDHWVLASYCPGFEEVGGNLLHVEVYPDEEYVEKFTAAHAAFMERFNAALEHLKLKDPLAGLDESARAARIVFGT